MSSRLTIYQASVIKRARALLADPGAVVPDSYADDRHGRTAYLLGYVTSQLKSLLEVTEELAGLGEGDQS